jgi:hypothetical protein
MITPISRGTGAPVSLGADITLGGSVFTGVTASTANSYAISGADKLTLATPTGARSSSVRVDFGIRTTISSELSGTSGFTKTGNGTLVLGNNANTYTVRS